MSSETAGKWARARGVPLVDNVVKFSRVSEYVVIGVSTVHQEYVWLQDMVR